jgi:hypothetical protein
VQLLEPFCLSEPAYVDYFPGLHQKYGTITKFWIGPYLVVGLSDAKYVEVSKMALA